MRSDSTRNKTFSGTLAVWWSIAVILTGAAATAHAQSTYQPPSYLRDSNGVVVTAGATLWTMDVDSSGQIIGQTSKQIAHGDTLWVCPRVLDPTGAPRPWATNTVFYFFYQSGAGMATSNSWWWDSTTPVFPCYHDVQQTVSTATIYNVVNSNVSVTVTTIYYYNPTTGAPTNSATVYTTNATATSSTATNYVRTVQTVSVVDTGRVAIAFAATNDYGFDTYTCYITGVSGTTISTPIKFQMNLLPSPTFNASVAPVPFNWIGTFSQSISNLYLYSLRVTTNGAPDGYYLLQSPTP